MRNDKTKTSQNITTLNNLSRNNEKEALKNLIKIKHHWKKKIKIKHQIKTMLRILLRFSIQVLKRNNFPMILAYPSMETHLYLKKEFIKTSLWKIPCYLRQI